MDIVVRYTSKNGTLLLPENLSEIFGKKKIDLDRGTKRVLGIMDYLDGNIPYWIKMDEMSR